MAKKNRDRWSRKGLGPGNWEIPKSVSNTTMTRRISGKPRPLEAQGSVTEGRKTNKGWRSSRPRR